MLSNKVLFFMFPGWYDGIDAGADSTDGEADCDSSSLLTQQEAWLLLAKLLAPPPSPSTPSAASEPKANSASATSNVQSPTADSIADGAGSTANLGGDLGSNVIDNYIRISAATNCSTSLCFAISCCCVSINGCWN